MKFNFGWIFIISLTVFFIYAKTWPDRRFDKNNLNEPLDSLDKSQLLSKITKDRNNLFKVYAIALVAIFWLGICQPTHQFNLDKKEAADQYESYVNEYDIGWSNFCDQIFSRLGSNNYFIYGKNLQMTYPNCEALKPSNAGVDNFGKHIGGYIKGDTVEHIGQTGRTQGFLDANERIFTFSPYWCWGTECVTKYDLL